MYSIGSAAEIFAHLMIFWMFAELSFAAFDLVCLELCSEHDWSCISLHERFWALESVGHWRL